jgi:ABC-type glutathione transport system ATPase component
MSVPAPELEREHPTTAEPVVEVDDLRVEVVEQGLDIVDEVSFQIGRGEVLGLVGESGSGKTTVGLALMGHTRRGARIVGGRILVDGREILKLPRNIVRALRGRTVSYVPQDPAAALNPAIRIGVQLEETLLLTTSAPRERSGANDWPRCSTRCFFRATSVSLPAIHTSSRAASSSASAWRWLSHAARA